MPSPHVILVSASTATFVAGGEVSTVAIPSEPGELAAAARAFFDSRPGKSVAVTLALPAGYFLAATLATADLPRGADRRQVLTYRLEEHVPLPAEEFVADFAEGAGECLAVCADPGKVLPLVRALESAGLRVDVITPAPLLFVPSEVAADGIVLVGSDTGVDVVRLSAGVPVQWLACPATSDDVRRNVLAVRHGRAGMPVIPVNVPGDLLAAAGVGEVSPAVEFQISDLRSPVRINLRRGALADAAGAVRLRRPVAAVAAAAVLLLLSVTATLLFRARQYDAIANEELVAQEQVFRQAFPAQAVPLDIPARLASEHRRLRAQSSPLAAGAGARDAALSAPPALTVLHAALGALPVAPRHRVVDLTIRDGRFTIEGHVRSHADASAIASALREKKLPVDDPRTEQLGDGSVTFTLSGSLPGPGAGGGK